MPAPQTDLGHIVDERQVLTTIGGPVAQLILRADISQYNAEFPERVAEPDDRPTDEDVEAFGASCEAFLAESRAALVECLKETTPYSCASLAILLGQVTLQHGVVTASPNAFSFEIELISTLESRTTWSSSFLVDDLQATLDALVAARQINIASHLRVFTHALLDGISSPNNLGHTFRTEWLSGRGRAVTAFDIKYLRALKQRLASHSVEVHDPELAVSLIVPFVERWSEVVGKATKSLEPDSYINRVVGSQSLLPNRPHRLSAAEIKVLNRFLSKLSLTEETLIGGYHESRREEVRAWLQALSLSPGGTTRNPDLDALVDAELKRRPFLRSGNRLLLALPHRLATDFSALFDTAMAHAHGEKYFAVRAMEVEESSLKAIARLASRSRFVAGATYASRDGKSQGEVDGVVLWEDVCFVLEGKGGFLSTAARKGSTEAALADLRQTISEGYFQAARLLGIIDREGSVTLTQSDSAQVTVSAKEIRKAYVLLPTADDLGRLATRVDLLWDTGLLPNNATPLIASIQELLLIAEILQTPEHLVAYLDYREEVLLNRWIHVADELEMLGAFVGGVDIVGSGVGGLRESGVSDNLKTPWKSNALRKRHTLHLAPVQQERHVNPWVARKYGRSFSGDPSMHPPTRHGLQTEQILWEMRERGGALDSVTNAICLDRGLLSVVLATSELGGRERLNIRKHNGVVAVVYARSLGLDKARRDHRVRSAARSARYVIYIEDSYDRPPQVMLVELSPGHASHKSPKANICVRSNVNVKDGWYQRFHDRRVKQFDKAVVAGLEAAGVPRDMAVGVDRCGLSSRVLHAIELKGNPARVASLWMSHLREVAALLQVEPAQLTVTDETIVRLAGLAQSKVIAPHQLRPIVEAVAARRASLDDAVNQQRAALTADAAEISAVIAHVCDAHQAAAAQAALGKRKSLNFLMGQVLRQLQGKARPDVVLQRLNHALNVTASNR